LFKREKRYYVIVDDSLVNMNYLKVITDKNDELLVFDHKVDARQYRRHYVKEYGFWEVKKLNKTELDELKKCIRGDENGENNGLHDAIKIK
jgi:hypothetical protein